MKHIYDFVATNIKQFSQRKQKILEINFQKVDNRLSMSN
ncbi:hypothetical protein BN891_35830 [Bacteroides xylanisolvens SD CC 2a]|nr:hypothetical protein BN891_35830 [Bacteroides xylanisolvens SD CC 2a]